MNISQAAESCGLPNKTVRYYEELGLVVPQRQEGNAYRVYTLDDVEKLRFLQRSRVAGFSLEECRELLGLYIAPKESLGRQSKVHIGDKITHINQQLIALHALRDTLFGMMGGANGAAADDSEHAVPVQTEPSLLQFAPMSFTLVDTVSNPFSEGS